MIRYWKSAKFNKTYIGHLEKFFLDSDENTIVKHNYPIHISSLIVQVGNSQPIEAIGISKKAWYHFNPTDIDYDLQAMRIYGVQGRAHLFG